MQLERHRCLNRRLQGIPAGRRSSRQCQEVRRPHLPELLGLLDQEECLLHLRELPECHQYLNHRLSHRCRSRRNKLEVLLLEEGIRHHRR